MGFGAVDAAWYVVAGAAVAIGGALVYWFRRTFRWLARRLKTEYLEWFREAVGRDVAPMLEAVMANSTTRATEITAEANKTALTVREELRLHTMEEGNIVRAIVKDEIAPLVVQLTEVQQTVTSHLGLDERRFEQAHQDLVTGQSELVNELQSIRAAIDHSSTDDLT